MSDVSAVKALVFDVFGTVVDWRTSLINDFTKWSETSGIQADWTALVDGWRAVYSASMDEVRKHPERGYQILDTLHRQSLEKLVAQFSIKGLSDADLHYLTMGWHRLHAWPDSVAGLTRLKTKYIISPLSNGNVALLTNMAKFAGSAVGPRHVGGIVRALQARSRNLSRRRQIAVPAAGTGDDGRRPQQRSEGRAKARPEDRLRPAPDRIRPATRNTISRPRATGTSSPRILAGLPTDGVLEYRAAYTSVILRCARSAPRRMAAGTEPVILRGSPKRLAPQDDGEPVTRG